MRIPVLIVANETGDGYVGSIGAPFHVSATGKTAADAAQMLHDSVQNAANETALTSAEVFWIDVPQKCDPEVEQPFEIGQGVSPIDDVTRMWYEAMNENRRRRDDEDRYRDEHEEKDAARQAS